MNRNELSAYDKNPLSYDGQVDLLKSRGLILPDKEEDSLRYYLSNVNYYHLSIYFKFFQNNNFFAPGTTFGDVLSIYVFDNKLRLLLLELLEQLEKSLKCRITYELSLKTGNPHCYLDLDIYKNESAKNEIVKIFTDEVRKNYSDPTVSHYFSKYSKPELPPFWLVIELLSFGQTVKLFKSLSTENRNLISRTFGVDEIFLTSWMHGLSVIRNHCAHHSRLWNRELTVKPKIGIKSHRDYFVNNNRLFNYFVILQIIFNNINPSSTWQERLFSLIDEHNILSKNMGFPQDYKERLRNISHSGK